MRRIVSAVVSLIVLTGPGVQAQEAPSPQGTLSVSPTTLSPNGKVTVSGAGCAGATEVSLFPGTSDFSATRKLATIPTKGDGSFAGTARISSEIGLGPHTISAVCDNQLIGSARIRVVILGFLELDGTPGTLTVSQSAVLAGRRLRILAQPCPTGTTSAALEDARLKLATPALVDNLFRADVTIPRRTAPGVYTLSTRCDGLTTGAATLRILATATGRSLPAESAGLPGRRINVLLLVIAVLALVLVVSITLSLQRQRTRTATPGYFDLPSSQRPVK